jgi:hypothetical protein
MPKPLPRRLLAVILFSCFYTLQCVRGSEDRDALVLVQIEKIFVARDNEVGISGRCAREDVIIAGIASRLSLLTVPARRSQPSAHSEPTGLLRYTAIGQ